MDSLSHYLLDVMTNSVEAGATDIEITIRESDKKNYFRFVVQDNGCGMNKTLLKTATEEGITTKRGKNRGQGLYLLRAMVEMSEGVLQISSHNGKSTCVEWTIKRDHDKRKPLGDLIGVIADFIYSYKAVGVYFTYATEYDTFSFFLPAMSYIYGLGDMDKNSDLKKMKKILQDNLERINYNK
ncbi:MAG: ATP-binding protein [Bacteroidales bacterium]